jgi:formylglycine-generating enzyme required for sulfatase activity
MQLGKLPLYIALVLMVVSCTKWELPEKCTEALPMDISVSSTGNTVSASVGKSGAVWSLINSSGQTVDMDTTLNYSFSGSTYPNGSYTIKAVGKNTCGFSFSLQKAYSLNTSLIEMANIPGGTFEMGDTRNEGDTDEKPVHTVTVSGFKMGKYEITQKQYQTIIGTNPSNFTNCDDCPVEKVSWPDAVAFCNALSNREGKQKVYTINETTVTANLSANGYRLPTEAEWEYAAGGGSSNRTRFGNGKDIANPTEMNFNGLAAGQASYWVVGEDRAKTIKVGSFIPNALGLYDMSGNVWEWCNDWYSAYTSGAQTNPTGAATGSLRVLRGGNWAEHPSNSRVANRGNNTPLIYYYNVGFRIVSLQ